MASSIEDRLLAITRELQKGQIPHAFGGAIGLAFYSEPRATADLDINIFLHPHQKQVVVVLNTVCAIIEMDDRNAVAEAIERSGQARMRWGDTPIDLFFSNTSFHDSCATRIRWVPYRTDRIPILSAEDLIMFKISYDRPQDWLDVGKMFTFRGTAIDKDYLRKWAYDMFHSNDRRIARLEALLARGTG